MMSNLPAVNHCRSGRSVHFGDPVIHPPVGEDGRVIMLKDLQVRAVDEIVREDTSVALVTRRADDAHVGRLQPAQRLQR